MKVLKDIGSDPAKPYIEVWNKIDSLKQHEIDRIDDAILLENKYPVIPISATIGTNITLLYDKLYEIT